MHTTFKYSSVGILVLLVGCFTSTNPVYEENQIIQDKRVEGEFDNLTSGKKDGSVWTITASSEHKGQYHIAVKDGDVRVELLGTMFRLEKTVFLDLFPIKDSGVNQGADMPTASQIIRAATYERRHVILKLELSDSEMTYLLPFGNGLAAALKKASGLQRRTEGDEAEMLVLPESKKKAQNILRQLADDSSVFNCKGQLIRKNKS
jgi:hypothetical protein